MNKLFRWLLGIAAIVGIVYYSIIKFIVPGYLAQIPPLVSNLAKDYITGSIDIARVEWNGALELSVFDVQVKDKKQQLIADLPNVKLHISPWHALFNTNKALDRVSLEKPTIYLTLNKTEQWNVQDFLKPSDSDETPFYGILDIANGHIVTKTPYGEWDFGLNGSVDGGGNPILAALLGKYGYVANQVQNPAVLSIMRHSFTTIPGVLWIVTAIVLFFYRLNKKRYNEIVEDLKKNRVK